MGRFRQHAPNSVLSVLLAACLGCGGGQTIIALRPPSPDFTLAFSSSTVTVPDGSASSPVNVSITAENGFAGTVQISLSSLPAGITSNPPSPFSVTAGTSTPVIFGATSSATVGNFTLTAQAVSGSLSHSTTLALTVSASTTPALPRTTYARTDSIPALVDHAGEPHHRHIVYDDAN